MSNTLVIGATGKVGRRVTSSLLRDGHQVRAAARHPETAPARAEQVRFDWADSSTWAPAVDGVDAMFLVGPFQLPQPDRVLAEFLATARGVGRVALLSSLAAAPGDGSTMGLMEDVLRNSGRDGVVLRSSWFSQNFTENPPFTLGIDQRGELITSVGDTRISFVDTRDLGDVASTVLVGAGRGITGAVLEVTGPATLTMAEVAAELSRASGRTIRYLHPTPAEAAERLVGIGLPPTLADILDHVDEATRAGHFTPVTDTVPRLLGRPARDFASFAAELAPDQRT